MENVTVLQSPVPPSVDFDTGHPKWMLWASTLVFALVLTRIVKQFTGAKDSKEPDAVPYWIPYVGNAYEYLTNSAGFVERVVKMMGDRSIMQFKIGPLRFYLIKGVEHGSAVARHLGTMSTVPIERALYRTVAGIPEADAVRFDQDLSGMHAKPLTDTPPEERIWYPQHQLYVKHLTTTKSIEVMWEQFRKFFEEKLEKFPLNEWQEVDLLNYLRKDMVEAATATVLGPRFLAINPDAADRLWAFDRSMIFLLYAVPHFLVRGAILARERFHEMTLKLLDANKDVDIYSIPDDVHWEPNFGGKFTREMIKFTKHLGFSPRGTSGLTTGFMLALNSNSVPATAWMLIEALQDKVLYARLKAEIDTAMMPSTEGGMKVVDISKLKGLPLIQSVYTETLRMHVAMNVTRVVSEDMELGGYKLKKGSMAQTMSSLLHLDEKTWGAPGHPASEFWADRHIIDVDVTDENGVVTKKKQFSMGDRAAYLLPFGGGPTMCPGRFFARQEILGATAMIIANFEVEVVDYFKNGTRTNGPPKNDLAYFGVGVMFPDVEVRLRLKRLA